MNESPVSTFWQSLPRPILGLSPMDDITDHPFRFITNKYGNPDLIYTEFTSVEGLGHGASKILRDYLYDETQRPIIGQIYGTTPKFFRQAAVLLCELGFDGIDINMGCPAKNVAHSGAGAGLIKTPELAQEILRQTQAGVEDWVNGMNTRDSADLTPEIWQEVEKRHAVLPAEFQTRRKIPVSVKTRIGYDTPIVEEWIPRLLEAGAAAIALHGRTLAQHYGGRASWDHIAQAAALAHQAGIPLLGNGDLRSRADALQHISDYGTDGALLGRAAMGNPFIFQSNANAPTPSLTEMYALALEHAQLYEKTFSQEPKYSFLPMRKHLGWYIHDIPNAAKIRQEIYQTNSSEDFLKVIQNFKVADTGLEPVTFRM